MNFDMCRLCLTTKRTDPRNFKNIFTSVESFRKKEIKLIDAIVECAPIHINENDNLPKDICANCIEKLQNSYEFRETCLESDTKLKLSLEKELKKESEHTIKEEFQYNVGLKEDSNVSNHFLAYKNQTKKDVSCKSNDRSVEASDSEIDDENTTSFTCPECGISIVSLKSYHKHLKHTHSYFQFIKCVHCNRQFPNADDLNSHIEKFHIFRCRICLETFVSEIQIEKHCIDVHSTTYIKNDEAIVDSLEKSDSDFHDDVDDTLDLSKPKKIFKCTECDKCFNSSTSLNLHVRIHTGERPFTCEICNKGFKQKTHLAIHNELHTGEKNYTCNLCHQSFATNNYLTKHKKRKHREEIHMTTFRCHMCEKSFISNSSLQNHLRIHSAERPFSCEKCGKAFKQKGCLVTHVKKHASEKRYICEICSMAFITNANLRRHMVATHNKRLKNVVSKSTTGERSPFTCDTCGKGSVSKQEHSEHIRIHAGEYPFMCATCGDMFKQSAQLRNHMATHAAVAQKAYSCDICSKEFAYKWNLRTHLLSHNDDLPHKCKYCPQRFKWRVAQWRHEMRHRGETPYKCSVCGKGFIEAGKLREHLRVHSGERPFKCEICLKSFKRTSSLNTHLKIHQQ